MQGAPNRLQKPRASSCSFHSVALADSAMTVCPIHLDYEKDCRKHKYLNCFMNSQP